MVDSPRYGRATITEVAKSLGISKSTVSRAFNRPGLLRPETVARVKAASIAMGYKPSRTARTLSTGRTSAIALVVPDIANPFFPRLIRAAQTRAEQHTMSCLLGDTDESAEREWQLVTEFAPDVTGVVLMSPRLAADRVRELAAHTNLVLINRDIEGLWRVLLDTALAFQEALGHLYKLGHRRFAYVGGPDRSWSDSERLRTIETFARTHGVMLTVRRAAPATYAGGIVAARAALDDGPTAFLCFDDVVAQGVVAALSGAGLRVPEDVSVIGCDDTIATTIHPQMATIALDYEAAGRAALTPILNDDDGDDGGSGGDGDDGGDGDGERSRRRVVPGRFIRGASLAPPGRQD